jgi:hypothetical protein
MKTAWQGGLQVEDMLARKPFSPHRHYRAVNRAMATHDLARVHRARCRDLGREQAEHRGWIRRAGACPPSALLEDES